MNCVTLVRGSSLKPPPLQRCALRHAGEAEAAREQPGVHAVAAMVGDRDVEGVRFPAQQHFYLCSMTRVLGHVRERFLYHAVHGKAGPRRQGTWHAFDLEADRDA
jgi:hypothetical protein